MKRFSRLTIAAIAASAGSAVLLLIFLGLAAGHVAAASGQAALAAAGFSVYAVEIAALLWLASLARALWRRCGRPLFRA